MKSFSIKKFLTFFFCAALLGVSTNVHAISFSGNTDADFPAAACFDDPSGRSVGIPSTFPDNVISGWDAQKICLLYDGPKDTLFVGIKTFDSLLTGLPIPFGDADGDGDPSHTSDYLAAEDGQDYPNLSQEEYFALILDFDADFSTPPEVVAGVSAPQSAPTGFRVNQVALPDLGVDFSFLDNYYGSSIPAASASTMFASPNVAAPHLEFTITGFSHLPGFANLDPSNPSSQIGLIFKAGSLGDAGIGDEDIRVLLPVKNFFDSNGDGNPDGGGGNPPPNPPTTPVTMCNLVPVVNSSGGFDLNWTTANATTANLSDGANVLSTDLHSVVPLHVDPTVPTTYTLTATGANGSCSQGILLTPKSPVPPIAICKLSADVNANGGYDLAWTTVNASSANLSDGKNTLSTDLNSKAPLHVSPTTTTTYTLSADGASSSCSEGIQITPQDGLVPPATTCTLTPVVDSNGGFNLIWTTTNATSANVSDGTNTLSTDLNSSLPLHVDPASATIYTLTAAGARGTCSQGVLLTPSAPVPPLTTCKLDASEDPKGGFDLTWTTTNTTSAILSDGKSVLSTDLNSVSPLQVNPSTTTTYTLSASGDQGACSQGTTINPSIDPDLNGIPNAAHAVQEQGSGFGACALIANDGLGAKDQKMLIPFILMGAGAVILFVMKRRAASAKRLGFFFIFLTLLSSRTAGALNSEQFRPNFDGFGLINLLDHRTLQKNSWSLGAGLSFAKNPIELGLVSTGARVDSLVDYNVNMTLSGAYGIADWVSVGLSVPFSPNIKIEPLGTSVAHSTAAFGDVVLAAKFRLWESGDQERDDIHMGLAASPFLTIPSGSSPKFVGDTNMTGGFKAAYDISLWKNKIVTNIGLRFREKETLLNLQVGQELLFGLGYTRPIYEPWDLHALTELDGSTSLNGFGTRENRTPLEWMFGIRKGFMQSRLQATVGGAVGITNGYGTPDYRVLGMVTYTAAPIQFKPRPRVIEKTTTVYKYAKIEGGEIKILQPIHFETAKWIIKPDSLPIVQDVANIMKNTPYIRRVQVQGHTDARGSDDYNLKLSQNRANAVMQKLIEDGVEPERLEAVGRGEFQPIASNKTDEGMALNRRTEFHIISVQEIEKKEEVIEKKEKTIKRKY